MATLVAIGYPDQGTAEQARQTVQQLEGELIIEDGGVRHALAEGDCLAFGPPADAAFINESRAPCAYLVALART